MSSVAQKYKSDTGKNGSGKTSFLEGIYLLATGKTSTTKRLDLIRDGSHSLGLAGLFVSDCGLESKIKLEKVRRKQAILFKVKV